MSALTLIHAGDLPQDPYLPQFPPTGPAFLDSEACLCALRRPEPKDSKLAWQCIGNQTQGVYKVTTGKWFAPLHDSTQTGGRIDDASNGPNTANALRWDRGNKSFFPADNSLGVYDRACTGQNQTTFSTAFYRAAEEQRNDKTMVDAAPCWRPGAVPIQIQTLESWQKDGCNEGFRCMNNTVNSLPQFCPPLTVCQQSRLAGDPCALDGITVGMGPFEPVVCPSGHYCPKGGREMILCPERTYCQPGASTPTPCAGGSRCPEGSSFEVFLVPLGILVIIDGLLIIGVIILVLRARSRKWESSASPGLLKKSMTLRGGIQRAITRRYRRLSEERDQESLPMSATYQPRDATWTGFQDVIHMAELQGRPIEEMKDELPASLRGFVESMRKATDAHRLGISFAYSGLQFHPRSAPKPILQGVTGSIERGTLTAVMGGSGAGKSTFVRLLMGKITNTGGAIMVNNSPGKIKRYKKLIGYVPQDDIVLPELTVYENILHSAQIRLPRTWTADEIESHVNSVIECLELSHVRDSLVGSVGKPVISGGQRKRVSIGMELAAAPMSIFLDEPTSGLDATSAVSMMRTLQAIARLGLSIIVIIHQPRMEIFEMLDSLILLGNGQLLYEGPEKGVQPYFENLGFHFPAHGNAGDVVTDIITGNGRVYKKSGDVSKESLIAHWSSASSNRDRTEGKHPRDKHGSVMSLASSDNTAIQQALKKRGAPHVKQIWLCFRRAMLQQYRTKSAFFFELGLSSVAGFLIGLAENGKKGIMFKGYYKEPYDVLSVAADFQSAPEFALLTAIAIGLAGASPAVRVFSEETLLYRREAEAGHSRFAYFVAKVAAVIPRMTIACLHLTTFLILMAVPGGLSWPVAFIANLAYFWAIYGLAAVVSMVARREDAPLFATILSLVVGILSGAAPSLATARGWHIEGLWRASPGTWFAELYFGQMVYPFAYLYQVDTAAQVTGFELDRLWLNVAVVFGIGLLYRVIAFVGLFVGHRLRVG
ncbi:ABC transporter (ATP-binding-cassette) [Apiospora saccharicola]|uniref:ABC transporter (ATP-binding-cassette) n=1 Tax=Apiospora saccharicola TaxID=335842 RepID=A0ABR1U7I0_9PEZI